MIICFRFSILTIELECQIEIHLQTSPWMLTVKASFFVPTRIMHPSISVAMETPDPTFAIAVATNNPSWHWEINLVWIETSSHLFIPVPLHLWQVFVLSVCGTSIKRTSSLNCWLGVSSISQGNGGTRPDEEWVPKITSYPERSGA